MWKPFCDGHKTATNVKLCALTDKGLALPEPSAGRRKPTAGGSVRSDGRLERSPSLHFFPGVRDPHRFPVPVSALGFSSSL